MPAQRSGFRIREIVFAVGLGALAAGGAAVTLAVMHDNSPSKSFDAGPSRLTYEVAPFEKISTSGPQDVEVTYGDKFSVRSEGSPDLLPQLDAVVENGTLEIRPKKGFFWGNWGMLESAKFYVTMPKLTGIMMAGSGDIHIDRVEGDSFDGKVGGSGTIAIDQLKVDRADFTVSGSGDLTVGGTARDTHVMIAGSGEIHAGDLHSKEASVSVFGSGSLALEVDDQAQVSVTGSGDVDISGSGHCTVTRMGSGNVHCEGGGGDE